MDNSLLINLAVLFDRPTGIATYAQNVVGGLKSLEPMLLAHRKFEGFQHYSVAGDMTPAQGSKGHFKRLLWTQFQLPQIYRQLEADLIYSPIPEAPLYDKARFIVMCHDLIPLRFPRLTSPLTNYFRFVVPAVLRQAEHIICNSQATATDLVDYYGIAAKKITPILLGYDRTNFYPKRPANISADTPADNNQTPYFLYLGRCDPHKNLSRLIAAFADLPLPDYHLAIAGSSDPRYTPQLKQQAQELGIAHRLKWLDYLTYEELPVVISNAVALVYPTLWEGFGLPVLEAMACGTPVITSDLASLPEVTAEAAVLIDPYNTEEITFAMLAVAEDSALQVQLQQLGLEQARKFCWAKTGRKTKEVLARFL